jgi:adenylate kinase family enzyme
MRIKVVGPCASGKSMLAARLRALGYDAASAAQDHSYVPDMWRRLNPPDLLIYLDVSLETARHRSLDRRGARSARGTMGWDQDYLDEQTHRLRHARAHCDLYVSTDGLSEEEVLARVLEFLRSKIRRMQQDAECET